jgi:class 3 adenylate cyclase/tetratricopeptide (TPR) repeat protein
MGDISAWLTERGLARYVEAFRDNDIDFDVLRSLSDGELKELGLSLGDRKRLLQAVASLPPSGGVDASAALDAQGAAGAAVNTADRRQLTVLFADLVDSTALSRVLDPEDLRDLIRDYHRAVADAIREAGGFVAKFMGDGVLAYFGYPHASEDAGERGVRAGLQALAAVRGLPTPHGRPVACRVGIATGPVVVGDVTGEDIAREVNVVGETPNLAARLLGVGQPDGVIIAASTRQIIGDLFVLEALAPQVVKGFAEPVVAYQVLGERRGVSRFEATRRHHKGVFVGRSQEVGLLLDRWELAQRGEGQLVMVSGEAGIGKSRITDTLWQAVANGPHHRIRFQCTPQHVNSPFYPAVSYASQRADLRPEEGHAASLRRLAEAVIGLNEDQRQLIAGLLGVALPAHTPVLAMQPARQRQEVIEGFSRHLEALAATAPLLWVVEDAHWIDPSTEALIGRVLDRVHAHRILIVVTQRPEYKAPWASNPSATLVQLSRLSRAHTTALLERLAGGRSVPPDVVAYIASRADGVPLFVEELFQALCDSGSLREGLEGFELTRALDDQAIPVTLQDSLMARLDRLAPAKAVAQIGSVIGREFGPGLLMAVAGMAEGPIREGLRQLEASGLLFSRGSGTDQVYVFKHALVQEAAYASLLRQRRQEVHGRVADALAAGGAEARPALLAHHLEGAGQLTEAAVQMEQAAAQAMKSGANQEAISFWRRALELGGETRGNIEWRIRVMLKLSGTLIQSQGYASAEAYDIGVRAIDLARTTENIDLYVRACIGNGPRLYARLDFLKVEEELARISVEHLAAVDILTRAQFLAVRGGAHYHMGRFAKGKADLGQILMLDELDAPHDPSFGGGDVRIVGLLYLARVVMCMGEIESALNLINRSLKAVNEDIEPFSKAWGLMTLGRYRCVLGLYAESMVPLDEGIRICERFGFTARLGQLMIARGAAGVAMGDSTGEEKIDQGRALWEQSAKFSTEASLGEVIHMKADVGRYDLAEKYLGQLERIYAETPERSHYSEYLRVSGLVKAEIGDLPAAKDLLLKARALACEQSALLFELRACRELVRLFGRDAGGSAHREKLAGVIGQFREGHDYPDLVRARAALAQAGG